MTPIGSQAIVSPALSSPANGLLASAQVIDHGEGDLDWINGVSWSPEACGDADVWALCSGVEKAGTRNRGLNGAFEPFAVIARDVCSSVGFGAADYRGRATRALLAKESKAVEKEFWGGELIASNVRLAQSDDTTIINGGSALSLRDGLAALVQGLTDCGIGRGMIHARPGLVEQWVGANLLRWESGKLYTATGHIVVPGSGYQGTGPDGTAPTATTEWAYATDLVQIHRGPVDVPAADWNQVLDRASNTVALFAERAFGIVWNRCCHKAVNIASTTAGQGSASVTVTPVENVNGTRTISNVSAAANTATLLVAANPDRISVLIVNNGTATIYLGLTAGVTAANGIPVAPGASLLDEDGGSSWYGISAAALDARVSEVA